MVRFDDYDSLMRACQRLFIGKVHFMDGFPWKQYFKTEQRALIVANHGPFLGPLVWVSALFPRIVDLGHGHLTYSAIAHPIIRNIPIFARIVGFEKRCGKRLRTADYIELFKEGRLNILSVAPAVALVAATVCLLLAVWYAQASVAGVHGVDAGHCNYFQLILQVQSRATWGNAAFLYLAMAIVLAGLWAAPSLRIQTDYYGRGISGEAASKLGTLTRFEVLDLRGQPITTAGLASWRRLTRLRWLGVDHGKFGDAGLAQLARFTRLQWLSMRDVEGLEDGRQLRHLARLRRLRGLEILSSYSDRSPGCPSGTMSIGVVWPALYRSMGMAAKRLVAKGYGESKPLCKQSHLAECRRRNRRTEFVILRRGTLPRRRPRRR